MMLQVYLWGLCILGAITGLAQSNVTTGSSDYPILTPTAGPQPRINGPSIYGQRPQAPFLYTIPVTGKRPIHYSAQGLPEGLVLNSDIGTISGAVAKEGVYEVILTARNDLGTDSKKWKIVIGEQIGLTPPMGWNSWNCWAGAVDQEKVMASARVFVEKGLRDHGWTYINIDDTWQGTRTPQGEHALQPNKKFPDMAQLAREIHAMGLKIGIYSTPWETSYAKYPGGSSNQADGKWLKMGWKMGTVSFARTDAKQWADWGIDYLKYDWSPIDVPHVQEMSEALRQSGRDIFYSLSNSADWKHASDYARLANSWRTTGDIYDQWKDGDRDWHYGVSEIGFSQDQWVPYAGPSHWNDPDMLVIGQVGWGPKLHSSLLTANQQYSHISLWCLLCAPLLIGCDLSKLDDFTLNLLTNDEVLAIDQDALGKQALRVGSNGPVDIYLKELEDGTQAIGFFNRSNQETKIVVNKLSRLGINPNWFLRDLWRQKELGVAKELKELTIPGDGVLLFKARPAKGA